MNVVVGRSGIMVALAAALVGAAVLAVGLWRRDPAKLRAGAGYVWLVAAGVVLATAAMQHALFTHDFSIAYVAQNNSKETPALFDATGMWSALQGSLLLWALVLSGYMVAMAIRFRRRAADPLVGWATLVVYLVASFFLALLAWPANPFARVVGPVPLDGAGPDPLLQNRVLVAFHPPLLYLGFVGFTVPFAFALASLVTGRVGEGWLFEMRRWTLFAWGCLGAGIVLGAWWSYQVLGWGGFWAWDPVENAALLPWLCATAYLHSAMAQERLGLLRVWNLSLLIATFALTVLGTFLTRSGVIQSVHAFSDSSLGPVLIGFFAAVCLAGVGLIGWRAELLRSPGQVRFLVSREGAMLANNALFAAFAFLVLAGTVFPLFVQFFTGSQVDVGAPYFNTVTVPLVLALLFLMAVAPALPWRRAGSEVLRRRLLAPAWAGVAALVLAALAGVRGVELLACFGLAGFAGAGALRGLAKSYSAGRRLGEGRLAAATGRRSGGMIVHLGVVVVAVALAAAYNYGQRGQVRLRPGQSATIFGKTLTYHRGATVVTPQQTSVEALVSLGGSTSLLRPAVTRFGAATTYIGSPAIASTPRSDVYLTLVSPPSRPSSAAVIGVIVQPLVIWIWIGGGIVAAGTAMSLLPRRRARQERSGGRVRPLPQIVAAGGGG